MKYAISADFMRIKYATTAYFMRIIEKRAYFHIPTTTFRLNSFKEIDVKFYIPPPLLDNPPSPQYNYL
jgi:hypothetical protein